MKKKNVMKDTTSSKSSQSKSKGKKKKDACTNMGIAVRPIHDTLINLSQRERESISENIISKRDESHTSQNTDFGKDLSNNVDSSIKVSTKMPTEINLVDHTFHCPYCNVSFINKLSLRDHCLTNQHQAIILSDEGRDWKFRPPPRGILSHEYTLCQSFFDKSVCRFSNQCIQAHSEKELSEWKERFEYRSMKLDKAKEKELHGATYSDKLIDKLKNSQNLELLLSEKIDNLSCIVSSDVNLSISQKSSKHTWTLTLHCPYQIQTIALLYDSHRNHFSLSNITMINSQKHLHKSFKLDNIQEWANPDLALQFVDDHCSMEYKIDVNFTTDIYGTFRQALVVDFGFEPVFWKKLCVDIVPIEDYKEIETARTTVITQCERWCEENSEIILFSSQEINKDLFSEKYLEMHPPPTNKNISLNQSSLEKYPTRNNYVTRLHDLLFYEEMAQFDLISHFNVKSYLHLTKSYILMPFSASEAKYSMAGELYAKFDLSSELSEDSSQGRLILNNCNSVLISSEDDPTLRNSSKERKAYETIIEGKTKKEIYLRLSQEVVESLQLLPDTEIPLDIQFQLNRIPLCEMHVALDRVTCFDHLFPDVITELLIPWSPSIQWNETTDMKLNLKQKEALVAITAKPDLKLPPILLIGPFGTGKTFTLGQAIKQLIHQSDTRILVCTHSNSAADIYIRDYLHPQYESGVLEAKPLRIYYHKRRTGTVQGVVQKYCLIENCNGEPKFALPTKEHVLEHRIIVTTINTSLVLANLGIEKGYFTHILIDEAAQVMECATLIPLSFADSLTRIVLAGDYMQLSTEVFSPLCKEKNLQNSLLERLYDLYPTDFPCKIMLVENYRSHPAIIKYTSNFFYEGRLMPRGKISAHPLYHPLTFFTAKGEDVQELNSTAFYNNSEVMEICERVSEILKAWPEKLWGPVKEDCIGVLTPYLDQVIRIRSALRKRKLYKVSVERVLNVQGKEFRAVVLSTVRTRHTCTSNDSSLDFGFLSNAKLLTTAITRAQSLVAVVGDPVSLCSLGKCRKLWEEFIRQCAEAGSLYGTTWTSLKAQLDGIEYRKIYGLNPLAQEFIPRYLLLPAVPPVALISQVSPYPYLQYARPLAYSAPNVFPSVPLPYHNNHGYIQPNLPLVTTVQSHKPFETAKPIIAPFNQPGFSHMGNIYQNHSIIRFANPPALGHIPALPSQNFYPPNPPLPSGFVQGPSLGLFMPGGLPMQSKFNMFPPFVAPRSQVITQSRPALMNQTIEPERIKMPVNYPANNITQNNPRTSSLEVSSSPDKNIQFLNNVHFPKGLNESVPPWNDPGHLERGTTDLGHCGFDSFVEASNGDQNTDKPFDNDNTDSINRFSEEVSRLVGDHSPIKPKPASIMTYRKEDASNDVSSMSSLFPSSSSSDVKQLDTFDLGRPSIRNSSLKSMLTLQQVEESFHSQSRSYRQTSNLVSNDSDKRTFNHSNSSFLNSSTSSQLLHYSKPSGINQSDSLPPSNVMSDSGSWSNKIGLLNNQQSIHTLSSSSSLPSSSTFSSQRLLDFQPSTTSNLPLYLRKGSLSASTRGDFAPVSNLEASKGWDADTVNNTGRSSNANLRQFNHDFLLAKSSNSVQSLERELKNFFLPKNPSSQEFGSDSKTYAGVLRSKLNQGDRCQDN